MDSDTDKTSVLEAVTPTDTEMSWNLQGAGEREKHDENEPAKTVTVGMICGKKDLYQKMDEQNNPSWTYEIPDEFEQAAENEETSEFALLVRNSKST